MILPFLLGCIGVFYPTSVNVSPKLSKTDILGYVLIVFAIVILFGYSKTAEGKTGIFGSLYLLMAAHGNGWRAFVNSFTSNVTLDPELRERECAIIRSPITSTPMFLL